MVNKSEMSRHVVTNVNNMVGGSFFVGGSQINIGTVSNGAIGVHMGHSIGNIHPSLHSVEREKTLTESFDKIDVGCGSVSVNEDGVVVVTSVHPIMAKVSDGVLEVESPFIITVNGNVVSCGDVTGYAYKWTVTNTDSLRSASVRGSSYVKISHDLRSLKVSGSSDVHYSGSCSSVTTSGSCKATIVTESTELSVSGSSSVNITASFVELEASGSSDVKIIADRACIEASGCCTVRGNVANVTRKRISGVATVNV